MTETTQSGQLPSQKVMSAIWMLLGAAICLEVLVTLVQQSMFFDGGIYASLARNLAEGRGSMWAPHFTETLFPVFAEHPPLMIWLQAIGFGVFGDTIAVEKGFSLITYVLSAILLFHVWMRLNRDDLSMQRAFPLALLLVLVSGRVNWAFANGMLENLVTVFSLAAVLLLLIAYERPSDLSISRRLVIMVTVGLAVSMSLLTKGPVGLFPLAAPAIYWLFFRRPSLWAVAIDSLMILAVITLFMLILYSFDAPREAVDRYLEIQLFSSLNGQRGQNGGGSWNVIRKLLIANGYSLAVVAVAAVAAWRFGLGVSSEALQRQRWQRAAFLIIVGLSASLPLGLSPRVSNFYLTPSLPFFASGFCILAAPVVMHALSRMTDRASRVLWSGSLVALCIAMVVVSVNFGKPGEDARTIEQVTAIKNAACMEKVDCRPSISACKTAWQDTALHTYMQRLYKISIAQAGDVQSELMIADETCEVPSGFGATNVDISPYVLLQQKG